MKGKALAFIPLWFSVAIAIGFYLGHRFSPGTEMTATEKREAIKISGIINYIEDNYVDGVDRDELVDLSIDALLSKLDPHSSYIPAEDLSSVEERLKGRFGGVGIRFMIHFDSLAVTDVIDSGPSQMAGVKPGDIITHVDGEAISGPELDIEKVHDLLKGEIGTPVSLMVDRKGKEIPFKIMRGSIPIPSVDTYVMLDDKTGYVRINSFAEPTYEEFIYASRKLLSEGMKQLVLDLRNNGGGYLTSATNIADEFLGNNKLIVYTEGENRKRKSIYAQRQGALEHIDLVVLINENSASASEILAGAVQDNDRGTIVGRRSFGKGLVQEQKKWGDGSALRLTIARYYTPTGRSIQKPYGDGIDYESDFYDRYESGELYAIDSSVFVDSLKYETPGGKIVYGGGGIMPDVFVPVDTTGGSGLLSMLRYADAFNKFTFDYLQDTRADLEAMGLKDFARNFRIDDPLMEEFLNYANERLDVSGPEEQAEHSDELIRYRLKSSIARSIWGNNGATLCTYRIDTELMEALDQFGGFHSL